MSLDRPPLDPESIERILEITRRLAAPFDLTSLLAEVVDAARAALRAERGTVFLYDPQSDELHSTVATGSGTLRFPASRGIVGECARTRAPINVPDCYADARFNPEVDRASGYRTRCLLTVPLIGHDDSLVGVLQVLNREGGVFDEQDQRVAGALAAQCAVALQRMRLLAELLTKQKLERELAVARDIQMRVLPRAVPARAGYELAGFSRPADQTGGDIYDIVELDPERLVLLLGDATGHGIGPALSVTQVRAMLRMALRLGADLDSTFRHINDQLADDLADNRFVTAFLGLLDTERHRVVYHAGGQGPLLHFHAASRESDWLGSTTMPLGFMSGLPPRASRALDLAPGDILGLITDGVFEYENAAGEAFGQARVGALVSAHPREPLARLIEIVLEDLERFADGAAQQDDLTLLLVRRA